MRSTSPALLVFATCSVACGGADSPADTDATDMTDAHTPSDADASADRAVLVEAVAARALPVPTASGLPSISGFSLDARIQPRGRPARWFVEYGPTAAYGSTTSVRALPGKLAAHFAEDWSAGNNGWRAGFSGVQLVPHSSAGPDDGPFVRYTDDQGDGNDVNHLDGIGLIHLGPYAYLGNFYWADDPPLYLGGGFPDLRGAAVSCDLRGVGWSPHGTEIGTWIQAYRDPSVVEVLPEDSRYPNYAFTGDLQTAHLASGAWERADWTLRNRTADWTFAGANGGRLLYDYGELETILGGVNVDFFLLQILKVDLNDQPSGSIDFANMTLTFRQHSLVVADNGGSLLSAPAGGSGAEFLSDGWRNGAGREWQSAPNPTAPQVFEYAFAKPVRIRSLNIGNAVAHPSKDVEVAVSEDGGATWRSIASGTLPELGERGPNYAFFHADKWVLRDEVAVWAPLWDAPVDRMRVTVTSGYDGERWGLGEIEAFGTGADEATEDDWYDVNRDILVAAGTWHYRLVVRSDAGLITGPDAVVEVP